LKLKDEFDKFYTCHFNHELASPIFYGFPVGIRYEIGIGSVYDKVYVKSAVNRALAIFNELFNEGDDIYLVVNSYEDDPNDLADNDISTVRPLIYRIQDECKYVFASTIYEQNPHTRYIIKASVKNIQVEQLLEAIVWSDIDGRNSLRGCVYWLNPRNNIIYYLYDDRGLDVVSEERKNLEHIYSKFNSWILEYDRERIYSVFTV